MESKASLSSGSIQFYALCVKWASDLNFYKIETAFFHRLIDERLKRVFMAERIAQLSTASENLRNLDSEIHKAEIIAGVQLRLIGLMADDIIPEDTVSLNGEQIQLEELMTSITSHFREVKKELFSVVEGTFGATVAALL